MNLIKDELELVEKFEFNIMKKKKNSKTNVANVVFIRNWIAGFMFTFLWNIQSFKNVIARTHKIRLVTLKFWNSIPNGVFVA